VSTGPTGPTRPEEITRQVIASFEDTPDERLREIMQGLVRHLHGFVADVGLTEEEWAQAIAALTATGHITDDQRQEFILWSDTLGVSMLVDAISHRAPPGATESTVLGPFYVAGSPLRENGADIAQQQAGVPAWVQGRVLGIDGAPIEGAELDVWQNGDNQLYAVQDPGAPDDHLRGRFMTGPDGRFAFQAVRPVAYQIPADGPVGRMLAATRRHAWRPAHIHMVIRAAGYVPVTTHIFDAGSDYLDRDTVFAVKPSLVRQFEERAADDPARPPGVSTSWVSLELDLVLAPGNPGDGDANGHGAVVDRGRTH
jgi:protocatechuate 3,4-dioxygenase beta subunit